MFEMRLPVQMQSVANKQGVRIHDVYGIYGVKSCVYSLSVPIMLVAIENIKKKIIRWKGQGCISSMVVGCNCKHKSDNYMTVRPRLVNFVVVAHL